MPIQARLVAAAISLLGPAVVPALRRAATDPKTREQLTTILGQIRTGVGETTPAGRAQSRLKRDLDATIALAVARRDSARDDGERALAEGWVREAQDIRNALDIAGALGSDGRKDLMAGLDARRVGLLRRMLEATLPDLGNPVAGDEVIVEIDVIGTLDDEIPDYPGTPDPR